MKIRSARCFVLEMAIVTMAQMVFAQNVVLTVSKYPTGEAQFTTVQAAVNAAKPGDVIEIIDAATYEEQVTIDSTKNGITLRSKTPTSLSKPVIKWRDTQNTSPKNFAEARVIGDGPGASGNYETCGTLRIKRARNITIDGIAVDGGSPFVFGWSSVWNGKNALFHGNAAITLIVAGDVQIRNCELSNAYFGIFVKDRNIGGVFGNPNPSDNDVTTPLSNFGKAGNHLFEYNRVHDNAVGFSFESTWDLGSTIRYNLIYDNYYTSAIRDAVKPLSESENQHPSAFLFKDNYLSPIAIYNNTLYNNYANFIGNWQIGGQHLIFNNIFGPSSGKTTGNITSSYTYMIIDQLFPNRMKHCVFSDTDSIPGQDIFNLQTKFQSTDPMSPNFLEPIWNDPLVATYIKNQGWSEAGIRNPDGTIADLGAIPSSSVKHQAITARINPTNVVRITNTNATANFYFSVDGGVLNNPQIKYLKWIYQIPNNTDSWGPDFTVVPTTAVNKIPIPTTTLKVNDNNNITFTIPKTITGENPTYGFFEMTIEGTDADGKTVTSDIGFLPYRSLDPIVTLRYTAGPGGRLIGTLTQSVASGSDGSTVVAIADEGSVFVSWSDGITTAERTDVNVTLGINVTAIFERNFPTLQYNAGIGGTITGVATQTVSRGSNGTMVVAVADDGYKFSSWSDGVTTAERTDKNVKNDISVTADFIPDKYTLRYLLGVGGKSLIGDSEQFVSRGAYGQEVYAVAENGYTFALWSDGSTANPRIDTKVESSITVTAYFADPDGNVSVNSNDRLIPQAKTTEVAIIVTPITRLSSELTVGPNPTDRPFGAVTFFRQGPRISSASLSIYNASGYVVKTITIRDDNATSPKSIRKVGSWNLVDKKGRPVSDGTYLVKGVIKTANGKSEKVSLVLGVR